jgi:hypothetical protein
MRTQTWCFRNKLFFSTATEVTIAKNQVYTPFSSDTEQRQE